MMFTDHELFLAAHVFISYRRRSIERLFIISGDSGYLSLTDWPLLPFYGVMCGIYLCMGIGWLVVCSMHFTELLRIQFYIGGVIFMGMLEKAMFYAGENRTQD